MSVRAVVLNDTRRGSFSRHIGCVAVMDHLLYLCRQHDIEIVRTLQRVDAVDTAEYGDVLSQVDVVLVNGEGTMHHDTRGALSLSRAIIQAKTLGKKTALLNAVWQGNNATNACLASLDFVCARDGFSERELRLAGARNVHLTADLSFFRMPGEVDACGGRERAVHERGALVVDSVDEQMALRLQSFAATHELNFRVMQDWRVREDSAQHPLAGCEMLSLTDLASTNLLVSGRFHAVCLAMKVGVPFLAVPSNSHKLEALLHDAGLPKEAFVLPLGWERQPLPFWLEHAQAAGQRHKAQIEAFATKASTMIERSFSALAATVGGCVEPQMTVTRSETPRRRVRICYFNTWAKNLEDASAFVARTPATDLAPMVSNPGDPALMKKARLDCDWYAENTRCFAAMKHEQIEFLPAWVSGQPGLADLAQRPRDSREERWLITMGHQPQALGAVAGKVFSLLSRLGVRQLFYAFDEASRFMSRFAEIAPHLDVLIHDESPLDQKGRAQLKSGCRTIHRSWVANVVPGAVPFNPEPEEKILFLGSQLGLTPHRQRQIEFLRKKFKERFVPFHDHSVSVADRDALNRYKVGLCPEGRKFTTPAMMKSHTDRPFWSGCLGMVPVSEDSKAGGRLQELHDQRLIMRYAHADLNALAEACERALAMPNAERRRIYGHFNAHETIGRVVANAIAVGK